VSTATSARTLVAGYAQGEALVLDEPLSFWGGFNPLRGEIIDIHHPQYRQNVTGKIIFIPKSRGSAGTPGGIAETLRNGSGPAALVLGNTDLNIVIGAMVANRLYQLQIPVLEISIAQMQTFRSGWNIRIDDSGISVVTS
jgi:predicted aconitase with swiveling domain